MDASERRGATRRVQRDHASVRSSRPGDPIDWFVRRAGVARFTTFACALGLALAALAGPNPTVALAGLVGALLAVFVGAKWPASRLLVPAIVIGGLFAGYLGGTVRVAALDTSYLRSSIGQTVRAELVITGAVRSSGGWVSAAAVVTKLGAAAAGDEAAAADAAGKAPQPAPPRSGANDGVGEAVLFEAPPPEGQAKAPPLAQGMIIVLNAVIEAPEGPSDTGFDQANQLRHQGIAVVLRAKNPEEIAIIGQRGSVSGWFDGLRSAARDHLSLGPDPRVNEVVQGVVMGDTAGIDQDWLVAFRRSGTAHMLSVSGLHVASLAAIMIGLMRLLRAPRWAGFLAAAGAALLIIPFVGASPPVVRSSVMIVVVLTGRWAGRGRDQWQVLALAAVAVLGLNPFALFDVGFQLSFAAFLGMLVLLRPLEKMLHRLPSALGSNLAVSLAACAGTAPIALLVFGKTSLVSPLANLLVVPTLPLVTGLGMASVFLGYLWSGLSVALDALASLPMTWTILVSRAMAKAPVRDTAGLGRALFALAVGCAALPLGLALLGHVSRVPFGIPLPFFRRTIAWLRARRPRNRHWGAAFAGGVVVIGLLLGLAAYPVLNKGADAVATVVHRTAWPDQVEVRVLDVGQGNAVLVRTPAHHTLLFDGGPAGCNLAGQLHALGISGLDLVVISHPHADHFAGLLEALSGVKVKALIDQVEVIHDGRQISGGAPVGKGNVAGSASSGDAASQAARDSAYWGGEGQSSTEAGEYLKLRHELAAEGCRYQFAQTGGSVSIDGLVLRFFAPIRPLVLLDGADPWAERGGQPSGDELNGASLVSVVSIGSLDVLLPGDAEADTLTRYSLPPTEILVVPHHGSRGGVSTELLRKWGTRLAVIPVGKDNSFGHPNPSTVSTLEQVVGTVLRTDRSGWVSCRVTGGSIAITTERAPTQ
jgi:competence protein ComEC